MITKAKICGCIVLMFVSGLSGYCQQNYQCTVNATNSPGNGICGGDTNYATCSAPQGCQAVANFPANQSYCAYADSGCCQSIGVTTPYNVVIGTCLWDTAGYCMCRANPGFPPTTQNIGTSCSGCLAINAPSSRSPRIWSPSETISAAIILLILGLRQRLGA